MENTYHSFCESYEELEHEIGSLADFRRYWDISQERAAQALQMSLSGYRKAEKREQTAWRDLLAARYITLRWESVQQAEIEANATPHLPHYPRAGD